jgi:formyltetrahydrofolate deformylase
MSVVMVISNHPDLADEIRPFGVPYFHVPATRENRDQAERQQLELLRGNVDLVVLARYMQIISPAFLGNAGCPLINIHHSFLPAFIGARPVPEGQGSWCQADRRHRSLRHPGPG